MRLDPRVALLSDVQGKFGDRFVVGRVNNEERIVLTEQRVEILYLRAMLVEDFLQRIDAIWALLDVLNPLVRVVKQHHVRGHRFSSECIRVQSSNPGSTVDVGPASARTRST